MQAVVFVAAVMMAIVPIKGLVPFTRALWDLDDPFRILEQTPLPLSKGTMEPGLALARADWKETRNEHIITLDVPGMKKDDVKIEVEENRVLRVSGERKTDEEQEGDKWHRAERTSGKFWRQFGLPLNADLEKIKAHLEDGVLMITVPKIAEDKRKQPKIINIAFEKASGEDLKATKADV